MVKRHGWFIALILFIMAALYPMGNRESSPSPHPASWEGAAQGDYVTLEGRVRLVGNDPFYKLVLTDSSGHDWNIDEEGVKLLAPYEQKQVVVTGWIILKKMTLANGKELEPQRILERITIK